MPSLVGLGDGVEHGVGDDAGAIKVECSPMGKRGQKLLKRRRGRPLVVNLCNVSIFRCCMNAVCNGAAPFASRWVCPGFSFCLAVRGGLERGWGPT